MIKEEVNYGSKMIRDGMDDLSICNRIYFDQSKGGEGLGSNT